VADRANGRAIGVLAVLGIPLTVLISLGTNLVASLFETDYLKQHKWLIVTAIAGLALFELIRQTFINRTERHRAPISDLHFAERSSASRLKIIRVMRRQWVREYLEKSLYAIAKLELDIAESTSPLNTPIDAILQDANGNELQMSPGADARSILDKLGNLVVLGAAGSGKTTRLAEFVSDLVEGAESQSSAPVPIALRFLPFYS